MMRFLDSLTAVLLGLATLTLPACSDTVDCTADLRAAAAVEVSSPEGIAVMAVTASNQSEQPCDGNSPVDPTATAHYQCWEQGGGAYTIRAKSGSQTWTQRVELQSDKCHVVNPATVKFVLTAATAD